MPHPGVLKSSRSTRSIKGSSSKHNSSRRTHGLSSGAGGAPGPLSIIEDGRDVTPKPLLGGGSPGGRAAQGKLHAFNPATGAKSAAEAPFIRGSEPLPGLSAAPADPALLNPEIDVALELRETPTMTLLHLTGTCVSQEDNKWHNTVTQRNAAYDEMVQSKKSDLLHDRPAQTTNFAQKTKSVMAEPPATCDVGCDASKWDIFDRMEEEQARLEEEGLGDLAQVDDSKEGKGDESKEGRNAATLTELDVQVNAAVRSSVAEPGCTLEVSEGEAPPPKRPAASANADDDSGEDAAAVSLPASACTASLERALRVAERAIQQNNFHAEHLRYRNFPTPADVPSAADTEVRDGPSPAAADAASSPADAEAGAEGRSLERLWSFSCKMTRGRTISGMVWNPEDTDLLAVSYGQFEFTSQRDGLVLFWSLKNPQFPERVLTATAGVTALDFSSKNPNLLAVGLYDGTVAIYDLRNEGNDPVLKSAQGEGKHMDPVWQVQWVTQGSGDGSEEEVLVSISTDGSVTQWSITKSLTYQTLMVLKRGADPRARKGKAVDDGGIMSRQASGFCFDFPKLVQGGDGGMYIAGTEDGAVHKCSCTYNEQYVQSYYGHTGPVYCVRFSPFLDDAFLSCSADWSVKLWSQNSSSAMNTFNSTENQDVVHDVVWSPTSSTVFGAVTADGRIEIWDIAQSRGDPIVMLRPKPVPDEAATSATVANAAEAADADALVSGLGLGSGSAAENAAGNQAAPELTSILFAQNAPVLVVGDASGSVNVYRTHGVGPGQFDEPLTDEEQAENLRRFMGPEA